MNKADFQRNFQWSYFGLIAKPSTVATIKQHSGIDLRALGVTADTIIPCTQPVIADSGTIMKVGAVLPSKTDGYTGKSLLLNWHPDIDEDASFMLPGVPTTGMIQGRHSVWYMSRTPARDTPRGYCPKYTRSTLINNYLLVNNGVHNGTDFFRTWRVYNKVYYTWNEAIQALENGEMVGAAIDKFLALGVDTGSMHVQIYYKNKGAVGYVEDGTPYVYPETATYALREYVRKIAGVMPEVRSP